MMSVIGKKFYLAFSICSVIQRVPYFLLRDGLLLGYILWASRLLAQLMGLFAWLAGKELIKNDCNLPTTITSYVSSMTNIQLFVNRSRFT